MGLEDHALVFFGRMLLVEESRLCEYMFHMKSFKRDRTTNQAHCDLSKLVLLSEIAQKLGSQRCFKGDSDKGI